MNWIQQKASAGRISCVLPRSGITAAAIAYFTSTGSGTGTATVGSSSAVTLHGTVTGNLYPGSSSHGDLHGRQPVVRLPAGRHDQPREHHPRRRSLDLQHRDHRGHP